MSRRREDLLRLVRQLSVWIQELDQRIEEEVARRKDAQRLMTHPGVGPQTALATVLVLGPAERFPDKLHLTSYLGLIPQEESTGGHQRFGHLTKQGNRLMRFLLVEAAQTASRYDPRLQRAYRRLVFRKGAAIAKVAVARKLAIRLYIMLRDGIDYEEFCRRGPAPHGAGRGSHAGMLGDVALV
jgi:transposase